MKTNLALVQGLLSQSREVRVTLRSNARTIARQAHLYGLICTARVSGDAVELLIAGPAALYRRTRLYARALGSLVPVLQASGAFTLRADVHWGDRQVELYLTDGAPLARGKLPRRFDSGLERKLAADLAKLGRQDWDLVREPEPISVGDSLVFPDFGLRHRVQKRQVLVEVVGFWTRGYLDRKLAALRAIGRSDLLVCIDAKRGVEAEDALDGLPVLTYRRKIDASAALAWGTASSQPFAVHRLGLRWTPAPQVETLEGIALTALSTRARQAWCDRVAEIREAIVVQLVQRVRGDSSPAYRRLLEVDTWRVPIVELRLRSSEGCGEG